MAYFIYQHAFWNIAIARTRIQVLNYRLFCRVIFISCIFFNTLNVTELICCHIFHNACFFTAAFGWQKKWTCDTRLKITVSRTLKPAKWDIFLRTYTYNATCRQEIVSLVCFVLNISIWKKLYIIYSWFVGTTLQQITSCEFSTDIRYINLDTKHAVISASACFFIKRQNKRFVHCNISRMPIFGGS